jgi:hypothetical protein
VVVPSSVLFDIGLFSRIRSSFRSGLRCQANDSAYSGETWIRLNICAVGSRKLIGSFSFAFFVLERWRPFLNLCVIGSRQMVEFGSHAFQTLVSSVFCLSQFAYTVLFALPHLVLLWRR